MKGMVVVVVFFFEELPPGRRLDRAASSLLGDRQTPLLDVVGYVFFVVY